MLLYESICKITNATTNSIKDPQFYKNVIEFFNILFADLKDDI
jgi:hypothetical protein